MRPPIKPKLATWLETLTVRTVVALAVIWVVLFAAIFTVIPKVTTAGELRSNSGGDVSGFPIALYVSLATAVSLGYSDVYPSGVLRLFAGIEVLGGLVLAGLTVNALISQPSRQTRRARRACEGWWVECVDIPRRPRFFSFAYMTTDGDVIKMIGFNHDPGGGMDQTNYAAQQVIETFFPMMLLFYQNDKKSEDYTEGWYEFTLQKDGSGNYRSYLGWCFDAKHGRRDSIVGRKVTDEGIIPLLESRTFKTDDLTKWARERFEDVQMSADVPTSEEPQTLPIKSDLV